MAAAALSANEYAYADANTSADQQIWAQVLDNQVISAKSPSPAPIGSFARERKPGALEPKQDTSPAAAAPVRTRSPQLAEEKTASQRPIDSAAAAYTALAYAAPTAAEGDTQRSQRENGAETSSAKKQDATPEPSTAKPGMLEWFASLWPKPKKDQDGRKAQAKQGEDPDKDSTAHEYNVFRDDVATLSKGEWEVALSAAYLKNNSFLQYDRALLTNAAVRYGLANGIEFAVTAPYFYSDRTTQSAPGVEDHYIARSVGDVTAQVTAQLQKETADYPSVNVTVGGNAPTGQNPYWVDANYRTGTNPVNVLYFLPTLGTWGVFGQAQFAKIVDPLVLFGGVGLAYSFPTDVYGHQIYWPIKWTYNFGFAFAVSEKATIGFSVVGSYQPNVVVDGMSILESGSEPILARMMLDLKIAEKTYLQPSVAVGISKDAPNAVLGLTARRKI